MWGFILQLWRVFNTRATMHPFIIVSLKTCILASRTQVRSSTSTYFAITARPPFLHAARVEQPAQALNKYDSAGAISQQVIIDIDLCGPQFVPVEQYYWGSEIVAISMSHHLFGKIIFKSAI